MAAHYPCFLALLFVGSIWYTAMAAFVLPAGHWQNVPDVWTSHVFYKQAVFAVRESQITGLVLEEVLEGQIWIPSPIGTNIRRFLIGATDATDCYKVYKGVVTHVLNMNGTNILDSFEAVLD